MPKKCYQNVTYIVLKQQIILINIHKSVNLTSVFKKIGFD